MFKIEFKMISLSSKFLWKIDQQEFLNGVTWLGMGGLNEHYMAAGKWFFNLLNALALVPNCFMTSQDNPNIENNRSHCIFLLYEIKYLNI